jgi:hypothetical protein
MTDLSTPVAATIRAARVELAASNARARDVEWQRFLRHLDDVITEYGIWNVIMSVAAAVRTRADQATEGSAAEHDYLAACDALEDCAIKCDLRFDGRSE